MEDGTISPGMVDAAALRAKVSKQLKIDLEDHEIVTIEPTPVNFLVMEKEAAERKVNDNDGVPIAASEEGRGAMEIQHRVGHFRLPCPVCDRR